MMAGGWLTKSPYYDAKMEKWGLADITDTTLAKDHVYVVFVEGEETGTEYLEELCKEKYPGTVLVEVERYNADNGMIFKIMKVAYQTTWE